MCQGRLSNCSRQPFQRSATTTSLHGAPHCAPATSTPLLPVELRTRKVTPNCFHTRQEAMGALHCLRQRASAAPLAPC